MKKHALFAFLLLAVAGCTPQGVIGPDGRLGGVDGDGEAIPGVDYPAGPLHPDALDVAEHPCFSHGEVLTEDRERIALHFTCEAGMDDLAPGRIVWGLEDGGYLRRIVDVDVEGTTAFLTTEYTNLEETVTDVDFEESDLEWDDARQVLDFGGRVLDDVEVEGGRSTVVVNVGRMESDPRISARGSFGFLRLKSVTSRNRVPIEVDLETHFHSDGPTDRAQLVELETFAKPFTLKVGPVRVRGTLHSKVSLGFVHTSDGPIDVTTRFVGDGVIEMGGTYYPNSGFSPYWNPSFTGTVTELTPTGDSEWSGKVYLLIEGHVVVDGNPGGTSRFEIANSATSNSDCDGIAWTNAGTIEGQTKMQMRVMGRGINHDFPALDITADSKEGTVEHESPPPGCLDDEDYGICEPVADIACGGTVTGDTSGGDAVAAMDAYPCNVGNYDSAELVYRWTATTSSAEFKLIDAEPTVLNHDLFVLDGGSGQCTAAECVAHGFNSVEIEAVPGRTYYLVVDGFYEETGPFQARLDCD